MDELDQADRYPCLVRIAVLLALGIGAWVLIGVVAIVIARLVW